MPDTSADPQDTAPEHAREFLRKLEDRIAQLGAEFYFRGESRCNWYSDQKQQDSEQEAKEPVYSTLYRIHRELIKEKLFRFEKIDEKDIINKAKEILGPRPTNFEVLAELQHYGGKTSLIDFSSSLYVALFFACHDDRYRDKDGRIILVNKADTNKVSDLSERNLEDDGKISCLFPPPVSPRVRAQSSVFLCHKKGMLESDEFQVEIIPADVKPGLLELLREYHNIERRTIYNDIHGFVEDQGNFISRDSHFYRGWALQQKAETLQGNEAIDTYNEAIKAYSDAIKADPQSAAAYNNRGVTHKHLGQYDKALVDYNQAIELDSKDADFYTNRGSLYGDLEQYDKALDDYNRAITLNPNLAEAYNNRGYVYYDLGQLAAKENKSDEAEKYYQEAIKDYNQTTTLNSAFVDAYFNRGNTYYHLGQLAATASKTEPARDYYGKALAEFQHAQNLFPLLQGRDKDAQDCEDSIKIVKKALEDLPQPASV